VKQQRNLQINRSGKSTKAAPAKAQARAVADYVAKSARELTFKTGDTINIISKDVSGIWQGELNGKRGVFPSSHVSIMN
jgi:hypothetical protein